MIFGKVLPRKRSGRSWRKVGLHRMLPDIEPVRFDGRHAGGGACCGDVEKECQW